MSEQSRLSAVIDCPECSYRRVAALSKVKNMGVLKCPRPGCGHEFEYRLRLRFDTPTYPDISPESFAHGLDRSAISALRNAPGLDLAVRKMMEYGYERLFRVRAMADAVKVTPNTLGHIHDMAEQSAKCLGVTVPDVFIFQDPRPNAFTIGTEYPLIVLHSELVDLLDEDELFAVIAHEAGHIKCHHVLYLTLYDFLKNCLWFLGALRSLAAPLNLALAEWRRKAELSSDRASLVVTDNKNSIIKVLMKISAGSRSISRMTSERDFLEQARQFENLTKEMGLNKFYRYSSYIWRSHPFAVLRAAEIDKWADGPEYEKIRKGDYKRREKKEPPVGETAVKRCPQCDKILGEKDFFCDNCGHPAEKLSNQYDHDGMDEFLNTMKSAYSRMREYFAAREENPRFFEGEPRMCTVCGELVYDPAVGHCPRDGGELV